MDYRIRPRFNALKASPACSDDTGQASSLYLAPELSMLF